MITIYQCPLEGKWEVWTDLNDREFSGRCLSVARTKLAALKKAQRVIRSDATQITKALNAERRKGAS